MMATGGCWQYLVVVAGGGWSFGGMMAVLSLVTGIGIGLAGGGVGIGILCSRVWHEVA